MFFAVHHAEAAEELAEKASKQLGARGLISLIDAQNAPSIRVAERLGARWERDAVLKEHQVRVYVHPDP